MRYRLSSDRVRFLAIVAAAMVLHLILLAAPVVLVHQGYANAANPRTAVFLLVVSVWCLIESMASTAAVAPPMRSHGPKRIPLVVGLSLLITFWVSLTDLAMSVSAPFGALAAAGTTFMVAGIVLRHLSLRTLGAFFLNEVAIMPTQPLITHGIYGSLRHPSETGTLCLAFGGAIVLGSVYGLMAGALILLPGVIWRTRLEDRMLRNHYADEFGRYAREVPAFLPKIRIAKR